jgi:hypothetical protein
MTSSAPPPIEAGRPSRTERRGVAQSKRIG